MRPCGSDWLALAGQGEGQACHWVGEGLGRGRSEPPRTAGSSPLLPDPPAFGHLFPFRSRAGALRQGNKSNSPPSHCHLLGFHTSGASGRREPLPFSQCLRCAPSGPPGPGILFAADVTGLRSRRGWGAPAAAGRELSGKGPALAAGREFDGLLCRPRGSFLIPLCVPAHSPLTLSDKLLSRRPPGRGKKGLHSGLTLNPLPVGPGRGAGCWGGGGSGGGGSKSGKMTGDLSLLLPALSLS